MLTMNAHHRLRRRAAPAPAWLLVLALGGALVAGGSGVAGAANPTSTGGGMATGARPLAPLGLEALQAQAVRQQEELKRLEGELQAAQKAQAQGEREAAQRAQEIERLKNETPGVAPDLRLQDLLAQAQAQAVVLSQQASELRSREARVRSARSQLVLSCDQILAADSSGKLPVAQRLTWLRLRTAQVEALHGAADRAATGAAVRTVVQAGAALAPDTASDAAGGDDPQALRERADLLRDSADKLRREVQRLKTRSDELSHRQRLRERAARVDEDLFAEQTSSRHLSTSRSSGAAADSAAPLAAPAPSTGSTAPTPSSPSISVAQSFSDGSGRLTIDPSTLNILQRVESLSDPAAKLQALQRAQVELGTLTEQLLARAARLERRADELAHKK